MRIDIRYTQKWLNENGSLGLNITTPRLSSRFDLKMETSETKHGQDWRLAKERGRVLALGSRDKELVQ
jgi:hypothetical protein